MTYENEMHPLIAYHRVNPLLKWLKLLCLLVLVAVPAFFYWWGAQGPERRQQLKSQYPLLARFEGDWNFGVKSPDEATAPISYVPPTARDFKPEAAKKTAGERPPPVPPKSEPMAAEEDQTYITEASILAEVSNDRTPVAEIGFQIIDHDIPTAKNVLKIEAVEAKKKQRKAAMEKVLAEGGATISHMAWERRKPLSWSDFRYPSINEGHWGAFVSTRISISPSKHGYVVYAYQTPERSWCSLHGENDRSLAHEQLHFDITELFARKLRAQVHGLTSIDGARVKKAYDQIMGEWRGLQGDYDRETVHSTNRDLQAQWETQIALSLTKTAAWEWIPKWRQGAKDGAANAMFYLATDYQSGKDVEPSEKLAESWYFRAARAGSSDAENNIGAMFQHGVILAQNDRKAFRLYRKAAKNGHTLAQFNLGWMYWKGRGTKQSNKTAVKWFVAVAEDYAPARRALQIIEAKGKAVD